MSPTGSHVHPDIIVFPPDQVADLTDEERAMYMRFKVVLATKRACKMKTQIRERLIQRLWGTGSKVASRVKENDVGTCAMLSSSSSGAAPECPEDSRPDRRRLLVRRGARQEADHWMVSEKKQVPQDCSVRS